MAEKPPTAWQPREPVLRFASAVQTTHWTATWRGHTYDTWQGEDRWWRVRVDGKTMMAEDGTTAWGTKERAMDEADNHARMASRATGGGGRA